MFNSKMFARLIFVIQLWAVALAKGNDLGVFWQITDIHYDANYSLTSLQNMCHQDTGRVQVNRSHGIYGDYLCDSPWALVSSAINVMKQLQPKPDFILWTGDSVPHVPESELSPTKVFTLIGNVTQELLRVFPDVPIYPSLGNHDSHPVDQVPVGPAAYYDEILDYSGWHQMLDDASVKTFKQGGFYSTVTNSGLQVIALNTILWYTRDRQIGKKTDPSGQFQWLATQLKQARDQGKKVLLCGHISPGVFAQAKDIYWYYPIFNVRFLDLLQNYSDVITSTFFGHEHTDSFRVVYSKQGKPIIPMFLAPAVTPWKSSMPTVSANNPSVRLYTYNKTSGQILDYNQYYLNMTAANLAGKAHWLLEYQTTATYGIGDVSAKSLDQLVKSFETPSSENFRKYYVYNSVSYDNLTECGGFCKWYHVCAMLYVDYTDYKNCLDEGMPKSGASPYDNGKFHWPNHRHWHRIHKHHRDVPAYMFVVLCVLAVLVIILFFVITLLCWGRRYPSRPMGYFSQPRYILLSSEQPDFPEYPKYT